MSTSKDQQDLTKALNRLIDVISKGGVSTKSSAKSSASFETKSSKSDSTIGKKAESRIENLKTEQEILDIQERQSEVLKSIIELEKDSVANSKNIGNEKYKTLDASRTLSDIISRQVDLEYEIVDAKKQNNKSLVTSLTNERKQLKISHDNVKILQARIKSQDTLNKSVLKASESLTKKIDNIKNPIDYLGKTLKEKVTAGILKSAEAAAAGGKQVSGMGIAMKQLAGAAGVGLLIGGLKMVFDSVMHTNKELVELQRNFGMSKHEAEDVHHEIQGIAKTTAIVGANEEALTKAYGELASVTGQTGKLSAEMLETQVLLTKQLGMSSQEASDFQMAAVGMNQTGDQLLDTIDQVASNYEKITGDSVNQTELAKDLSKVSKKTLATYKGDAKALAAAAIQAKKMGMSLEDAAAISEKMLDVESSLEAEMKANVLTGKSMNLDKARQLALDGDIAEAAAEAVHQAGSYDEFMKLRPIQQKAIAEAAGMTVEQLTKAGELQKFSSKLSGKEIKAASDLTEEDIKKLETTKAISAEKAAQLRKDKQSATFQDNLAKVMDKLKAIFNSLAGKLEPVLDMVGDMVGKLADGISWFITGLSKAKESFKAMVPDWMKSFFKSDAGGTVTKLAAGAGILAGGVKLFKAFRKEKPEAQTAENTKQTADNTKQLLDKMNGKGGGGEGPGAAGPGAAGPGADSGGGAGEDIKTSIGKKLLGSKLGKKLMKSKLGKMLGGIGKSPIGAMIGDATGIDIQGMLGGGDAGAGVAGGGGGGTGASGGSNTGKLLADSSKKGAGKLTETAAKAGGAGADVAAKASKGGGFFSKIGGWLSEKASKLNPLKALKGAFQGPGLKKILGKIPKIGAIVSAAMSLGSAATAAGGPQEVGKQLVMAIGDMGGTFLGGLLGSIIPGAGTLIGGFLGGMAGSSLAGLIADNVDLSSIGKTAIEMFGGGEGATAETAAPEGAAPVAVKDALIRPGMPPVTFDKGDLIMAGTNLGGGQGGGPVANNSSSEIASLLKQLIAKVDQPVQFNIGGKAIDEISKQTSVRKSYSGKVDGAYGAI